MVLCKRLRAFSACSVGQASKPDRSSLSRSRACHSASMRVGCSLDLSVEMVSTTRGTRLAATILATEDLFRSLSNHKCCFSTPPQLYCCPWTVWHMCFAHLCQEGVARCYFLIDGEC